MPLSVLSFESGASPFKARLGFSNHFLALTLPPNIVVVSYVTSSGISKREIFFIFSLLTVFYSILIEFLIYSLDYLFIIELITKIKLKLLRLVEGILLIVCCKIITGGVA